MNNYKITCAQFNRLVEINHRAKNGDDDAIRFMESRNRTFYSKKAANEALRSYKKSSFYEWLYVVDDD